MNLSTVSKPNHQGGFMKTKSIVYLASILVMAAVAAPIHVAQARPKVKAKIHQQRSEKQSRANFGGIVSREAKLWKTAPKPGYRNFGAWVSSQRKHKNGPKTRVSPPCDVAVPTVPFVPTVPSEPSAPIDVAVPTIPTTNIGPIMPPISTEPAPDGGMGT